MVDVSVSSTTPHGVMFHHFHGGRHPKVQGSISAEDLARMIEHCGRDRFVPAREWLDKALTGRLAPGDLCLTFDDGLRCQSSIARPVLEHFGLTAFWFVCSSVMEGNVEMLEVYRRFRNTHFTSVEAFYAAFDDAVLASPHAALVTDALRRFAPSEYLKDYAFYTAGDRRFYFIRDDALGPTRYAEIMDRMLATSSFDIALTARDLWMDDDVVSKLHREGHVVGLHSHTHPTRLTDLSPERQEQEYQSNRDHLERLLGEKPITMSHPCNSYTQATLQILRRLGVRLGFCATMGTTTAHSELEHPRIDHADVLADMKALR